MSGGGGGGSESQECWFLWLLSHPPSGGDEPCSASPNEMKRGTGACPRLASVWAGSALSGEGFLPPPCPRSPSDVCGCPLALLSAVRSGLPARQQERAPAGGCRLASLGTDRVGAWCAGSSVQGVLLGAAEVSWPGRLGQGPPLHAGPSLLTCQLFHQSFFVFSAASLLKGGFRPIQVTLPLPALHGPTVSRSPLRDGWVR